MIKIILLIVCLVVLILPVLLSGGQEVNIDFLPFMEPQTWSLGSVMLLFAGYGIFVMGLFGLMDRMELTLKNRKMKKEIARLEEELGELRQIVTLDQGPS